MNEHPKTSESEDDNKRVPNLTTEKLIEMRKKQISRAVFDMLDTDFDDLLLMTQFHINNVPGEILNILNELFGFMKNNFKEVEYELFEQLFGQYYDKLTPTEKHMLLLKKQKKLFSTVDCSFKPQLNAKSLKMALNLKNVKKHQTCTKKDEVFNFKPHINK